MNVSINNYLAASYLLSNQPDHWDVIVVLDSRFRANDFVRKASRRHLALTFDDIESPKDGSLSPREEDIQEAIDFADGSENLLVTCRAGQSRSAALAYSISYWYVGAQSALGLLNPKRHSPNGWVIQIASEVLSSASLWKDFQDWKKRNESIRIVDFIDEIAMEFDELESLGAENLIC